MIKSVKGSATRHFLVTGKPKFKGLDVALATQRLIELNAATSLDDLEHLNSAGLHKLKAPYRRYWSIEVNGPWRIWFVFADGNATEVHINDRH